MLNSNAGTGTGGHPAPQCRLPSLAPDPLSPGSTHPPTAPLSNPSLPPHSRLVSQPWVSYTGFSPGSRHRPPARLLSAPASLTFPQPPLPSLTPAPLTDPGSPHLPSAPTPFTFPQPRLPSPSLSPGSPRRPLLSVPVPLIPRSPHRPSFLFTKAPSPDTLTVPSPSSPHARCPAAEGARPPRPPARAAGAAGVREQLRLAPLRHRAPPGPGLPAEPPGPGWDPEGRPGAAGRAQPRAGRQREESGERRRAESRQPQQQRYGRARASPGCLRAEGSSVPSLSVPGIAVQQNSGVILPGTGEVTPRLLCPVQQKRGNEKLPAACVWCVGAVLKSAWWRLRDTHLPHVYNGVKKGTTCRM